MIISLYSLFFSAPLSHASSTLLSASSPPSLPFPQSALLFLESLLGQENVYTVAMVRNLPGVSV